MIYFFHGDNPSASRQAMRSLIDGIKNKTSPEIIELNGETITLTDLIQAVEAKSLFSLDKIVIIECLLSRRPSKEKDSLISYLLSSIIHHPSSIIVWEPKPISAAVLKKFSLMKGTKIQEFKLPFLLFKFLDSLMPGRGKQVSELFAELTSSEPVEMIVFMLARRITQLLLGLKDKGQGLREIKSEWQKEKIRNQANQWTQTGLLKFHKQLLEIDEAVKTGSTPADLATHLDILLLSL